MATLQNAVDYARTLVRDQNSESLTDADSIAYANDYMIEMQRYFVKERKPIKVSDLTIDFVNGIGIYTLPADVLLIRTASADLTGDGEWFTMRVMDANNIPPNSSLQLLRTEAAVDAPYIDPRGNQFEVFPTPAEDVTDGFKYQAHVMLTPFTTLGDTVAYPFSQDYQSLGYGIAAKYLEPLNAELSAKYLNKSYKRVGDAIDTIGTGIQLPTQAKSPVVANGGWCQ